MFYSEKSARCASFVTSDGYVEKLKRVPFMTGSFNEAWLQELLASNPSLIPAGEFGSEYSPLVCIGREVPVGTGENKGYIDNLYITPAGRLVVVETKLFRNQQARRTVVAQVIDYAKELQKWDCEWLDKEVSDYFYRTKGQAMGIIDVMASEGLLTFSDEAELTDRINKCLKNASFLLLIVGDGIRTGVQQLADFLNENSTMPFDLGLVEMEVYNYHDGTIVVPNVVTKTAVIERAFAPGTYGLASFSGSKKEDTKKPLLSRREFIDVFSDNGGYDPDQVTEFIYDMEAIDGVSIDIAPTELSIKLGLDNGKKAPLLTFGISGNNRADLYMRPDRLILAIENSGHFPSEANSFLGFYKDFIDTKACKAEPYEIGANRFYYSHVGKVLSHSRQFVRATEQLLEDLS